MKFSSKLLRNQKRQVYQESSTCLVLSSFAIIKSSSDLEYVFETHELHECFESYLFLGKCLIVKLLSKEQLLVLFITFLDIFKSSSTWVSGENCLKCTSDSTQRLRFRLKQKTRLALALNNFHSSAVQIYVESLWKSDLFIFRGSLTRELLEAISTVPLEPEVQTSHWGTQLKWF